MFGVSTEMRILLYNIFRMQQWLQSIVCEKQDIVFFHYYVHCAYQRMKVLKAFGMVNLCSQLTKNCTNNIILKACCCPIFIVVDERFCGSFFITLFPYQFENFHRILKAVVFVFCSVCQGIKDCGLVHFKGIFVVCLQMEFIWK